MIKKTGNRGVTLFHHAVITLLSNIYSGYIFCDDFNEISCPDSIYYSDADIYLLEIKSEKEMLKVRADYSYKSFKNIRRSLKLKKFTTETARWMLAMAQLWDYSQNIRLLAKIEAKNRKQYLSLAFPNHYAAEVERSIQDLWASEQLPAPSVTKAFDQQAGVFVIAIEQCDMDAVFKNL